MGWWGPSLFSPHAVILPIIMERLEKLPFMQRIRVLHAPLQVLLCGGFLLFMVPAACALFPQRWYLSMASHGSLPPPLTPHSPS